jgi:hypothetical protein
VPCMALLVRVRVVSVRVISVRVVRVRVQGEGSGLGFRVRVQG